MTGDYTFYQDFIKNWYFAKFFFWKLGVCQKFFWHPKFWRFCQYWIDILVRFSWKLGICQKFLLTAEMVRISQIFCWQPMYIHILPRDYLQPIIHKLCFGLFFSSKTSRTRKIRHKSALIVTFIYLFYPPPLIPSKYPQIAAATH